MAQEKTYRSPGYYNTEIDKSQPVKAGPTGIPAAVIGTSKKGPAFVPYTVGNWSEFKLAFGDLDTNKLAPYAVKEFLNNRNSLTFLKVLGAGANSTSADIATTSLTGRVKNAGFKIIGSTATDDSYGRHVGAVQFLVAKHTVQANEAYGVPLFSDNSSFNGVTANLVRAVLFMPNTARALVLDGNESTAGKFVAAGPDDSATISGGIFKFAISSSLGSVWGNSDQIPGVRVYSASLNPTSANYIGKILNTNPDRFYDDQHYLYLDYAVDDELATPTIVGMLSGSSRTSTTSAESSTTLRDAFGGYDTRYRTPSTSWFISQPYGSTEYDLFRVEALDDGEYANSLYKITISNLKASLDESNPYGSFTLQVRDWADNDLNPIVLEQFVGCTLDPTSPNYVAKLIGDRKITYNFDTTYDAEKRIVISGKYANNSAYIRVVMSDNVDNAIIPATALPFGFHGRGDIKTNDNLNDTSVITAGQNRLTGYITTAAHQSLSASLVPPLPYRFKVTKGDVSTTGAWAGQPGPTEIALSALCWGVKFERNNTPTNPNITTEQNPAVLSATRFSGLSQLDVTLTGSAIDTQNNAKFTLARVLLSNTSVADLTASVSAHMREAAYVRNAKVDSSDYTYSDVYGRRLSLATVLTKASASVFNNFAPYAKFTNILGGGWDGVNFLDKYSRKLNDRSTSFDTGGAASSTYVPLGFTTNYAGASTANNAVNSYKLAIDLMTDPTQVNHNLINVPGIRESYVTDYLMSKTREYGYALSVIDIPSYDDSGNRLFDDSTAKPSVDQTAAAFDGRVIDNNYSATYWPDVFIADDSNKRRVKVPASVAAYAALGFNDRVAYPWYAPAGFNRASLDNVKNVSVRLSTPDRDRLSDSRINAIATFPKTGFVVFDQKTLQIKKSYLSRVNVRRLLVEVKRIIADIARRMQFENASVEVRNNFVKDATFQLAIIQSQSGIDRLKVICNETNNTQADEDANRVNGKIIIQPTKSYEVIDISFYIMGSQAVFSEL